MNRREVVKGALGLAATLAHPAFGQSATPNALRTALETVRERFNVPALGGAVIKGTALIWHDAVGTRKRGDKTPVSADDLWHIGSCGKAMTATALGLLVERGQVRFESPLSEVFPELKGTSLGSTTLMQLLSHQSGLPANFELRAFRNHADPTSARLEVMRLAATRDLVPGKFVYSNWGYVIAGAVIEKLSGNTFEIFLQDQLFKPLGIASAGFGGTSAKGLLDQPWPHAANGEAYKENGSDVDNPRVMSPAGRMHLSLPDWSRFIRLHLLGANLQSGKKDALGLLSSETYAELHKPRINDYALGWMVPERKWAAGRVLHHGGDNTLNFAVVWAAPKTGTAAMVTINQSSTGQAGDAAVSELIKATL